MPHGNLGRHMQRRFKSPLTLFVVRPSEIQPRPRWLRVVIPLVSAIAIIRGVWYLVEGTLFLDGVFLVVIGITLGAWSRRRRAGSGKPEALTPSYAAVQAFAFSGGCVLIGIALFVLAAIGLTSQQMVWGALGLLIAAGGACLIVRETLKLRR
jgi:hypothetical protein